MDLANDGAACGTVGYIAPEIIECRAYKFEVDVWSMGVVAYILLAGYAPFQAADDEDSTSDRIRNCKPLVVYSYIMFVDHIFH